ncbi:hypothetical protein ACFL5H_02915 [Candidatus Latescibacterota bacterium]
MKKVLTLMLAFTIILFAGCIFGSDDGKDDKSSETLSAADYLPFKTGSIWVYSDTETDNSQSPPDVHISTSSMTCTGQETINGKTYWKLIDNEGYPSYLRIENNDAYGFGFFEDMFEEPALKGLQETGEMLLFRFGVSTGTTWEVGSYDYSEEEYTLSTAISGKYIGTESVTVPAGTYANCAKIEWTITVTSNISESPISVSFSINMYHWIAPNVGPVKTTHESTYEDIIDYTYESVLTSYTPGGSATPQ